MGEDTYSFDQARVRLEEIASQVRKKDTSLEKSLDLLEEGVRLANLCTEQIDHTQWKSAVESPDEASAEAEAGAEGEVPLDGAPDAEEAVCEPVPGGAEAVADVPSEDTHGAASEPIGGADPDPEA